jgi:ATP/maltotriose-dependent transcriptional regulator MalT/DNA-binding SARP family transcriptional activator
LPVCFPRQGGPLSEARPQTAFAKTTRPALSAIVPRERLFARLDGQPGRTVAWVSGPPGSGKTSLVASYLEARRYRILWYQIDPDDSDVATFFHYLAHAARKLDAGRAGALPTFKPEYGADLASFSRKFFRQLLSRPQVGVALVLDNLHRIPPESPLHAVLEAAFSEVPKHCCVLVTSRSEPPAAFARLRVTGEMVCVGAESLHFDAGELVELAKVRGQALEGEMAAQLFERTRGWAAAIVLMLEHAKLSGSLARVPDDAAPKALFDYLAGEIFDRFEPDTRDFLLRIACLPRMTAGVAEALSGYAKGARLLVNLALNDYFVSEVRAEEGRVYQLHPLLRDFLRGRAELDLPEAVGAEHLKRAAQLLRAAGHVEDSVSLLIDSASWPEVAALAAEQAPALLAQGRSDALGRWLDLLPGDLVEADPRLLLALGACRSASSPRAARRSYERAYEAFRRAGDEEGMRTACCGVVEALIAELDDLAPLDEWIGVLSQLLEQRAADAADPAAATLARATLLRDPARAQAVPMAMLLERATPAVEFFLGGSLEKSVAAAHEALARASGEGVHASDGLLRATAAAALLAAGDADAARGELQRLEAGAGALRRGERAALSYLRAWLAWLDGDTALANREARAACGLAAETGVPLLECLARVGLAALHAEAGDARDSDAQVRAARALSERIGVAFAHFAVEFAAADIARQAGDEAAARNALANAFRIARQHGYQCLPWWRRAAAAELCALALRHGIEREFVRGLVRAHALMPRLAPLRLPEWPWRFRVFTLGRPHIERGTTLVEFSGKGPGRPLELLKVLIANGGQGVRAEQLADALWPHVEADYAHKSFTAALHRLRRLLDEDEALTLRDGRLALNPALVWVDVWALDQALAEFDDALRAVAGAGVAMERLIDDALRIYRGPFLPEESEQPSYIAFREQTRARLLRCLSRTARAHEDAGRADAAADLYMRFIESDPLFEPPYRNLMLLLQRRSEPAEARAVYERLRTALSTRLKVMPSAETQAVFAALSS